MTCVLGPVHRDNRGMRAYAEIMKAPFLTFASQSLMAINVQSGIQALSVTGGYGIDGNGERFLLEHVPKMIRESHNDQGRCTVAVYQYEDGSVLEFVWSAARGECYRLGKFGVEPVVPSDRRSVSRPC